jgi:ATP-dependent exoDNAse (exonuclease V) beta subunit
MSFIVYKASAGSGKTFNLAKEYLKIALQNPDDFRHILAITFTNKAANEMKSRIVEYLADFASENPEADGKKSLLPILVSETNLTENEIIARSSIVLKNILYKYADFSVMTIDSFFQKIIRSFSHDLHIPINFKLEISLDEMVAQIVDNLIDLVGEDKATYEILIQYINKITEDKKSWHIEKNLSEFSKEIFSEKAYKHLNLLNDYSIDDFLEIIKNLRLEIKNINQRTQKLTLETIDIITAQNIDLESFSGKSRGIGYWLAKVANGHKEVAAVTKKALSDDIWFAKGSYPSSFDTIKDQVGENIQNIVLLIRDYHDLTRISKEIYALALVNQIKNVITQIKDQENLFFLSETNFVLADVLRNEPTPFIYERIGEKYFHFFIDEFQDTSQLQWNNMLPLILEAISGLHNQKPGSAIIFGDPKQSIYRFRGGDFMQFINLPNVETENDQAMNIAANNLISANFKTLPLNTNFRSKAKIVDFNNHFFESIKTYIPDYVKLYDQHEQESRGSENQGIVDITIINSENKNNSENLMVINNRILDIINLAKKDHYQLKDIAILGRDKKNLRSIANFLINNNIPIITSDSLRLDASPTVRFLKNMICLYKNPNDEIINTAIIEFITTQNKNITLEDSIGFSRDFESLNHFLQKLGYKISPKLWSQLNIYDLCEEIIRSFNLTEKSDAYVIGFVDVVFKYHSDGESEAAFSDWWNDNKDSFAIAMPEGIDGIKILTIHAAKGLQYPIVICPNNTSSDKASSIWISSDEMSEIIPTYNLPTARISSSSISEDSRFFNKISEEKKLTVVDNINIAYVAFTRAVNRLYILLPSPSANSLKDNKYTLEKAMFGFVKNYHLSEKIFEEYTNYFMGSDDSQQYSKSNHEKSDNNIDFNQYISKKWYDNFMQIPPKTKSKSIEWGSIFHYTMQHIKSLDDLDFAINKTKLYFSLSPEDCKKLINLVIQTCKNPKIEAYFDKNLKIYNEKSIMNSEGEIFRPDRLILKENSAFVLDFKTGKAKESHLEQITNYKQLLLETGINEVKAFVVYVDEENIEIMESL